MKKDTSRGFTILELLIVIGIIGILVAIVMVSLDNSREKGRDAGRKSQTQEILKALELYYSDNGAYPMIGGSFDNGDYLDQIDSFGGYLNRLPDESDSRYFYCVSADGSAMVLAIDTEQDRGGSGSEWCHITRGVGPYGCTFTGGGSTIEADDSCATRF